MIFGYYECCCYVINCSEATSTVIKVPKQTVSNTYVGFTMEYNDVYGEKVCLQGPSWAILTMPYVKICRKSNIEMSFDMWSQILWGQISLALGNSLKYDGFLHA